MISSRAASRPVLQRSIRTTSEAIWITDDILSRALQRFYRLKRAPKRDASSVPGPMESRKRTGKRRMTNLSEAANIPEKDFGALWGLGGALGGQQWQWEAPSKRQPFFPKSDRPHLPAWLSGANPMTDDSTPASALELYEPVGLVEQSKTIEDQMRAFEESLKTSSKDQFEAICESYNHCFRQNLVLGLVPEAVIHRGLEVVTKAIQDATTDDLLVASCCLSFYAAVWNGIKTSKVLRPVDLGSGLLDKLLISLAKLPCSIAVQSLATDVVQTSSHDQLDGMRRGISLVIRAWLSSWNNLKINDDEATMDERIVHESCSAVHVKQSLLESVRTLAKFLDELPRFLIQKTLLRSTNHLVSAQFASFKGPLRKLRHLRYAWVSVVANMPCVNEKLLIEVWRRMDFFNSVKNSQEYVPSIPRLSLHESCTLLLDFWISNGQINAPENVRSTFAASIQKYGRSDSVVHLIQAMNQNHEAWARKVECLFRFLRSLGKQEAVYHAFQLLVAKNLSPPIYVFAKEIQEMCLIDPRRALNIYKLHYDVQNNGPQLLVDLCPDLVLAMIKSPIFDVEEIWATLNITQLKRPFSHKPIHPARIRLVQQMALAFARADFRSPRIALRNVLRCMLYLRWHGVPASKELSRGLTGTGITRSLLNGRWVGREKALWILDYVEKAEGYRVRNRVEQIWEDTLMEGIVQQQRSKREANPLRMRANALRQSNA